MLELADLNNRVRKQKYCLFKWFRDFKNSDCKYYVGKHDIKPIFGLIRAILSIFYHVLIK